MVHAVGLALAAALEGERAEAAPAGEGARSLEAVAVVMDGLVLIRRGTVDDGLVPLSWHLVLWKGAARPIVQCRAGHRTVLMDSVHSVARDGTVSPSYVCTVPGCSFHEMIRLEGWGGA